ncbi:hypothetical protein JCM19239_2763 [Vibrio variabilis]|uniref:Uncharacterized protein n=1 Tax=Vibrio variabilis TaxID=990271 RepID=A0ABQ0JK90_9VIBR|nr:hypothetical protein JCM19239_2763 [Vibrio variabilis]
MFPVIIFLIAYLFKVVVVGQSFYAGDTESYLRIATNDGVILFTFILLAIAVRNLSLPWSLLVKELCLLFFFST